MRNKHVFGCIITSSAFLFLMVSISPAFCETRDSFFTHEPVTHEPFTHEPFTRSQVKSGTLKWCNTGFNLTKYSGQEMCVKCNPDFKFTKYHDQDLCVKCNPGFRYMLVSGDEVCVK